MAQLITTTVRGDLSVNRESNSADLHVDRATGRVGINRLVDDTRAYALDVNGDLYADNLYGSGANLTGVNFGDRDTDDLAEGSGNLYYTDARVHAALTAAGQLAYNGTGQYSFTLNNSADGFFTVTDNGDGTVTPAIDWDAAAGSALDDNYVNTTGGDTMEGTLTVNPGAGQTAADNLIAVGGDLSFIDSDGTTVRTLQGFYDEFEALDVSGDVGAALIGGEGITVTTGTGDGSQTTLSVDFTEFTSADIVEGSTNLFYTDGRVHAALGVTGDLTYDGAGTFGFALADHDTGDLAEGANLYFTPARVQGGGDIVRTVAGDVVTLSFALADHSTDDLAEGSGNLYFTGARAIAAVEGAAGLTFTGGLTLGGDLNMGGNDITNVGNIDIGAGTLTAARIQSGDTYVDVAGGVVEFGDGGAAVGTVSDTEVSFTNDTLEIDRDNATDHVTLRSGVGADNYAVLYVRNGTDNDDADLVVRNLTVNGTTTIVNSEQVAIADNILVLNSDVTGAPTANGGIEIERGTEVNASLIWDEATDEWRAGVVGAEVAIALRGDNLSTFTNDLTLASFTVDITSDDIPEGSTNLYYTDARVHGALAVTGDLTYDGAGTIGFALANHDTADLAENPAVAAAGRDIVAGQNAYFTAARAIDAVQGAGTLALEGALTVAGASTFTGDSTFNGELAFADNAGGTQNLSDLYDQVQTLQGGVGALTTDDIAEGTTNLFFTEARVHAALSATGDLNYDGAGNFHYNLTAGDGVTLTDNGVGNYTIDLTLAAGAFQDALDARYANIDGDTFTGAMVFNGAADFNGAANFADATVTLSSDQLQEGSGALFFTDARVHAALAAGGQLAYDDAGTFSFSVIAGDGVTVTDNADGTVTVAATLGTDVTTDDVEEGSGNLYFTDERVDDRVAALVQNNTGITWTYDDAAGTLTPAIDLDALAGDQLDDNYVNVGGDTMTGDLVVEGDVTFNTTAGAAQSLQAWFDDYMDAVGGGTGSLADQFVDVTGDDMTGALRIGADFTGHTNELLFVDGDVTVTGTLTAGAIVETSTIRMKEQVINMGSQLERLMQLNPVEFTWKTNKKRDMGLIAEQVQKIYPEFVGKDARGATGVNYSKLTSVLIQSVKELNAKVEELQAKLRQK